MCVWWTGIPSRVHPCRVPYATCDWLQGPIIITPVKLPCSEALFGYVRKVGGSNPSVSSVISALGPWPRPSTANSIRDILTLLRASLWVTASAHNAMGLSCTLTQKVTFPSYPAFWTEMIQHHVTVPQRQVTCLGSMLVCWCLYVMCPSFDWLFT